LRPYFCSSVSFGRRAERNCTTAARGGWNTLKFVGDAVRQAVLSSSSSSSSTTTNRDGISSNVCGVENR
jgi:hypothetical protein